MNQMMRSKCDLQMNESLDKHSHHSFMMCVICTDIRQFNFLSSKANSFKLVQFAIMAQSVLLQNCKKCTFLWILNDFRQTAPDYRKPWNNNNNNRMTIKQKRERERKKVAEKLIRCEIKQEYAGVRIEYLLLFISIFVVVVIIACLFCRTSV